MNERVTTRLNLAELRQFLDMGPAQRVSRTYSKHFKRLLDISLVVLSLVPALVILVPLMALIALDGCSPIYTQKRVGVNGRKFRMFKLRTMVADADQILDAYLDKNPLARAEWDDTQKLKNDPRITFFGRFLRKSSLDELPQLLNVLFGQMSIVGPRPMMEGQEELYPGRAYYALRPGITGYWQISARNQSSFAERAEYDTLYYRELSFKNDVQVILRTVSVVFNATGY